MAFLEACLSVCALLANSILGSSTAVRPVNCYSSFIDYDVLPHAELFDAGGDLIDSLFAADAGIIGIRDDAG